jgi:hypothetical protein
MIADAIIGTGITAADGATIIVSAGSRTFARRFSVSPGVDG